MYKHDKKRGASLTSFPDEVGNWSSLSQLRLHTNNLTSLPPGFCIWATALGFYDDADAMSDNSAACP